MKRLIVLSIFTILAIFTVFAEDVILLTNGATIRAKVIECSSVEVKYFNLDIHDGPIFTLFDHEVALAELNNGQTYYYSPMNFELTKMSYDQIFRFSPRNYYHEGKFYHRSQMEDLLKNSCEVAFQEYRKGKTLNYVGWGLFAGGFVLDAAGIALMNYGALESGWALLTLGSATTLASIPTIIIGQYKINNAYKKYNKQDLSLNVGVNPIGVGLVLQF